MEIQKTIDNKTARIQGDNLCFDIDSTQTGNFTLLYGNIILQPTTVNFDGHEFNGVSAYGYTASDKPFILKDAARVESHIETTTTGNYQEQLYILPVDNKFNYQKNLFNNSTTLSQDDLSAIKILVLCLASFNINNTTTVYVKFNGSEEEKIVAVGEIENSLKNYSIKNKKLLNWVWQDNTHV